MTGTTLFTGGGGADLGMSAAGLDMVQGVELDERTCELARHNGIHVTCADILQTDPRKLERTDALHASPPCTNASVASQGGEVPLDIAFAEKIAEYIRIWQPKIFTLENVIAYRNFKAFEIILNELNKGVYFFDVNHIDFSTLGVPQSRSRLIVRACKDRFLPALPSPRPHGGWLAAIEDLLPGLERTKFAPWQKKKLAERGYLDSFMLGNGERSRPIAPPEPSGTITANRNQLGIRAFLVDERSKGGVRLDNEPAFVPMTTHQSRAFLVDGNNSWPLPKLAEQPSTTVSAFGRDRRAFVMSSGNTSKPRGPDSPVQTITATKANLSRALLESGEIVRFNERCNARLQTFPDSYEFSQGKGTKGFNQKAIGNAVPVLAAQAIYSGLLALYL